MDYNFGCMIASDTRWVIGVKLSDEDSPVQMSKVCCHGNQF